MDDLPKTPSGKIMRKVLREQEYERTGESLTRA
jgi:acyl-coenzyme A synthetase/AMP-(fatty) acid ligase